MRAMPRSVFVVVTVCAPLLFLFYLACSSSNDTTPPGNDGGGGVDTNAPDTSIPSDSGRDAPSVPDAPSDAADAGADAGPLDAGSSVTQYHKNLTRDGVYIDPLFTKTAAMAIHHDTTFTAAVAGPVYAQPLYVESGVMGKDTIYIATQHNVVYAIDAVSGSVFWQKSFGTPVPLSMSPCGNIDPQGITGTPVIDLPSRTMYFDAYTTPDDAGVTKRHKIYAISIDDGSVQAGWPVDTDSLISFSVTNFDSSLEQQRPALTIVQGILYVPYGGFSQDCPLGYRGWLIGVPLTDPMHPKA